MTDWHDYSPGNFPEDIYFGDEIIPIPVEVMFDNGTVLEDWIVGGELFLYCQKSFAYMTSAPVPKAWRYQYEPDVLLKRIEQQRAGKVTQA